MSMEIWMTKAGIGDCILVRCGNDEKKVNILIDSGQGATGFDSVLNRIYWNEEQINLLVFTHDDNDHVKGACNLVERIYCKESGNINKDIPAGRLFSELTEEQILFNFGGKGIETLAARDVERLADVLKKDIDFRKLGFVLSDEVKRKDEICSNMLQLRWEFKDGDLKSEIIRCPGQKDFSTEREHLELVILSPKKETLMNYIESAWSKLNKKELLGAERRGKASEWNESIQYWMKNSMTLGDDDKKANNASIAFLLCYEGYNILFSGDASPDEMVAAGKEYLRKNGKEDDYLELDFIKLAHHGSSRNISREFLRFFQTKKYLISTSGHAGYKHPGKGTLAEIASVLPPGETAEIYGNYNWWSQNDAFWRAEWREGNWNDERDCCTLEGTDGSPRYLHFCELNTEQIEIQKGILLST